MTIHNGESIKAVQELNLPDAVIALNVFYFKADFQSDQDDQTVVDVVEAWIERIYGEVVDDLSDQITLGSVRVYTRDSVAQQWDLVGSASPSVSFTETTEMLPHGVSLMVRAYTTKPRTIGRKYIPGMCEIDNVDGAWTAGALTAGAAFGSQWHTDEVIDANNKLNPGVFSKALETVYELNGVEVVLADPAYQRRRRPGVGT